MKQDRYREMQSESDAPEAIVKTPENSISRPKPKKEKKTEAEARTSDIRSLPNVIIEDIRKLFDTDDYVANSNLIVTYLAILTGHTETLNPKQLKLAGSYIGQLPGKAEKENQARDNGATEDLAGLEAALKRMEGQMENLARRNDTLLLLSGYQLCDRLALVPVPATLNQIDFKNGALKSVLDHAEMDAITYRRDKNVKEGRPIK